MTSGFGAQPDQQMPAGPWLPNGSTPAGPQATNAAPGFAAFAATTQEDWQTQIRDAFLNGIGLGQLVQLCNLLNGLPFVENIRAIGDKLTNGATGSIPAGIGALIDPLITAISDFVHAFDNIDWTNPATIIPTLLRDAITACWNLFWAIVKWAIYVIDTITNLDALSGVRFLQGLSNWLELYKLKDAFNTLLNTWESLDFAGAPLVALPQAFMAFVTFLQAIIAWFWDVVTKVLGITLPGWFHWAELGAVWTAYRTALQGINWLDIPTALFTFVSASITALQGIGRWILDVFTSLIGSSASVIHTMFANPIAFLNQMILHFFGTSGQALWQSALDFMTGLTGSTPIAALKSLYTQLQNLGGLFGNLTTGNLLGFLTTFFNQFSTNFSSLPSTLQGDLTSLFTAVGDMGQQVLDTLIQFFTGVSSTSNPISALIPAMSGWGSTLLSEVMAPVMSAVGNLSISNLVGGVQNLLLNPGFSSAISLLDPSNAWTWDDTVFLAGLGVKAPGSASVTASGVLQALRSNTIAVSAGKTINAAISVLTNGLVSTGTPLLLQVLTELGVTTIASSAAPTAAATGWTGAPSTAKTATLSGAYTVPSSGVSTVTLRLVVDTVATAGQVWWDGAQLNTTGLMPNNLVTGLGGITDLGSTLQQTWDNVAGSTAGAGTLAGIVSRLQNLIPAGQFDATQLFNQVPTSGVAGIAGLADIGAALQQTWDQITNAGSGGGTLTGIFNRLSSLDTVGNYLRVLPFTQITNVLGGGSLGADLQALATNLFGSAVSSGTVRPNIINNVLGGANLGNDLVGLATNLLGSPTYAGYLVQGVVPSLTSAWAGTIHGSLLTGTASIHGGLLTGTQTIPTNLVQHSAASTYSAGAVTCPSSQGYTASGVSITLTTGASGLGLVSISATIGNGSASQGAKCSWASSDGSFTAADDHAITIQNGSTVLSGSATEGWTGIMQFTANTTMTLTMYYAGIGSVGTATFSNFRISAVPL